MPDTDRPSTIGARIGSADLLSCASVSKPVRRAAHVMPPYAAAGANTAIQDVHNLAWKLAFVLRGDATTDLLATYDTERRPADWFVADQSSIRTGNLRRMNSESIDGTALADPLALILGQQYLAGAIVGDGSVASMDYLDLTGQPGTRLPHYWIGNRRSSLDLVATNFALLTGPDCAKPAEPVPGLDVHAMSADWAATVGISASGALLVRPDHVIAQREPILKNIARYPNTILHNRGSH